MSTRWRFILAVVAGLLTGGLFRPQVNTPDIVAPVNDWPELPDASADQSRRELAASYGRQPFWASEPEPEPEPAIEIDPLQLTQSAALAWRFLGTVRGPAGETAWIMINEPDGTRIMTVQPGDRLPDDAVVQGIDSARITFIPDSPGPEAATQTRHLYEDSP